MRQRTEAQRPNRTWMTSSEASGVLIPVTVRSGVGAP